MEELIEISSDSNSSKYSIENDYSLCKSKEKKSSRHSLSDTDTELPYISLFDRIKAKEDNHKTISSEKITACTNNYSIVNDETNYVQKETNSRKRIVKESENQKKQNVDKAQKLLQKQQFKNEEIKRKALKKAHATVQKSMKPGECMRNIVVNIDSLLLDTSYCSDIILCLQNSELKYVIESHLIPHTILWSRTAQTVVIDNNGMPGFHSTTEEVEEMLLIMHWKEIITSVGENTFQIKCEKMQNMLPNKRIFLILFGLEDYFKTKKNRKSNHINKKSVQKDDEMNLYRISSQQLEIELTKLQIYLGINYRTAESPTDLSAIILQFSKAIAETPYKKQNYLQAQQSDCFLEHYSKDCVHVDKNGNGLQRLWQQQLTQFSLARLETAEAIMGKYPTPACLMAEYDSLSKKEGELLLQNIPIRRAAGPLTTIRKIGPELSKKMHTFFTTLDGEIHLSQ